MTEHPRIVDLVHRAVAAAREAGPSLDADAATIPVTAYTDPARLARERALFRRLPIPLAHASELGAGRVIVRELDGVSLLLTRAPDGQASAFRNACRHRGVRLVREDCAAKAFVCPYHGWTYDKSGALIHGPHACAFAPEVTNGRNLVPVHAEERHGIVWCSLDAAISAASHLGEIDDEIASLRFDRCFVRNRVVREHRGNWKMLVEGFLDGYHIRTLHRDTVYRFFHDAKSAAEPAGIHIRSASARKAKAEASALRDLATFNFNVFPSTTIIAHPDWTSIVTVQPIATDRFLWSHLQLVADEPANHTEAAGAHFDRSFALIDGEVFGKEDLGMCAEAQRGLETGANEELVFGRLESPAVWFHRALDAALSAQSASAASEPASAQQRKPVE
jgi:phenylpropionate dioxygenase-like ring-hydroxylating dioxygenase large terminal subunit